MGIQFTGTLTFVAVNDLRAARPFYENILGFQLVAEAPENLVFDMGNTALRISVVENFTPQPFTVLGWAVSDIEAETKRLRDAGIIPLRYENMPQDDSGIAQFDKTRLLWFMDPAGNVLSLTQTES